MTTPDLTRDLEPERLWIWFADRAEGQPLHIRQWQSTPFPEGAEYVRGSLAEAVALDSFIESDWCLTNARLLAEMTDRAHYAEGVASTNIARANEAETALSALSALSEPAEGIAEQPIAEPRVPQNVIAAFEDRYHRTFDLSPFDGEWGNTHRYKHHGVQMLWEGWRDGYLSLSVHSMVPTGEIAELVARLTEYAKDWRDRAADASIVEEAAAALTALQAERDTQDAAIKLLSHSNDSHLEELGRVIMACPQGMRTSPASDGVKQLRAALDRLQAELAAMKEGAAVAWRGVVDGRTAFLCRTNDEVARLAADYDAVIEPLFTHPAPADKGVVEWRPTHRHVARGTGYELIGEAEAQVSKGTVEDLSFNPLFARVLRERDILTIYRAENGKLWARFPDEFHDGRFEKLAASPPAEGDGR